ncbi:hypothetical protein LOTGIDRAFT_174208 [Lottia gigantea]|uniref:FAM69 protein-kinase domain-containing protein n=1 Tax=Lottia gigantea TaxID=225164 RepID=V4AMZ4_LOTGI|nr:hypothetical protein LOTGIDRAFT_174208 [Lottia gigantea]ESO98522.1 hypothetical protein LOTGIDRAFT_174208 [Lottia gigantea]
MTITFLKCSDSLYKQRIKSACELYRQNKIVGKLCPALCDEKTVQYKICTNHLGGKISVLVNCDGVCSPGKTIDAVLKSSLSAYLGIMEQNLPELADSLPIHTLEDLRTRVSEKVNRALGTNDIYQGDVIQRVFHKDYHSYITSFGIKAFIVSVWSLVQQEEYLITKLFQHSSFFPKIYQSCGPFYLLESAPPGPILDPSVNPLIPETSTWKERVKVAIKLLDTVRVLDSGFNQTLHMCDIKGENFGFNSDGELKPIDPDDLLPDATLLKRYEMKAPCRRDKDCDILECLGICQEGVCLKQRKNNNLQGVCNMILKWGNSKIDLGVLRYPPSSIKKPLAVIIKKCIRPSITDFKPDRVLENKLRQLLLSSV